MIKLHGFAVSNYYNMVKFALLEKGLEFEEVQAMPSQEADYKAKSPMGKVPCFETEQGFLAETNVILDYIEALKPTPALVPGDAFAAARVREVAKIVELYIELPARRHYAEIFFGEKRNETAVAEAKPVIENGLAALQALGSFKPFICGAFSLADIVAAHSFIYAAPVCQAVYGWDIVEAVPGLKAALEQTNARPAGAKVMADQQAALQAFMEQKG
ncbi:MAG: glutathione S-transferase family protein [Gammaproteobacteria bacterium]|nr:glutathione S-transferase family protein [Gammaproteobacteria bacterium]MCP5198798.1 glutathione S-transferase family protein [Gammaproteobacteria bacterium]